MKHILDSDFRYRPSFATDVRKTFDKIRRQHQMQVKELSKAAKSQAEPHVKVLKLEQLKKVG